MEQSKNKTNGATYTKDNILDIVADALTEMVVILNDRNLVIAGVLAMRILEEKLK